MLAAWTAADGEPARGSAETTEMGRGQHLGRRRWRMRRRQRPRGRRRRQDEQEHEQQQGGQQE